MTTILQDTLQTGTCIVALRYGHDITMAADSRIGTWGQYCEDTDTFLIDESETTCKIKRGSNKFFMSAGFHFQQIEDIAIESCLVSDELKVIARTYADNAGPALAKIVKEYSEGSEKRYNKVKTYLHAGTTTIFCGFENGRPSIARVQLYIFREKDHWYHAPMFNFISPDGNLEPAWLMGGEYDEVVLRKDQLPLEAVGPVTYLNHLLSSQCNATPQSVGPPIEIITLRPTGEVIHHTKDGSSCKNLE